MLKVLIVDDEAVVRRGIVLGIDWASLGCAVVGEAATARRVWPPPSATAPTSSSPTCGCRTWTASR